MIFDSFFDAVFLINLKRRPDRLEACRSSLLDLGLSNKFGVYSAVDGSVTKPPTWFEWGDGAWGCLLSHMGVMQEIMKIEDFENKRFLILEDDVLFFYDAARMFELFIKKLGNRDWGQLYLGGQHTNSPEEVEPGLYKCSSVGRTHAYAINGKYVSKIHASLAEWPEYTFKHHHVDKQLEMKHRAEAWPVYAPTWWIAGQRFGKSDINLRVSKEQWWDYMERHHVKTAPFILIDCNPADYSEYLYIDSVNIRLLGEDETIDNVMSIASIAWAQRLLPAFKGGKYEIVKVEEKIHAGVIPLSQAKGYLQELINSRVNYV